MEIGGARAPVVDMVSGVVRAQMPVNRRTNGPAMRDRSVADSIAGTEVGVDALQD